MTSTAAGDHAGRESWGHRTAMWLGHYEPRISPVSDVGVVGYVLFTLWFSIQPVGVTVYFVVVSVHLVAMFCSDAVHGRNLCPRDIDDTLLDPQGAVDKNLRRLSWMHGGRQRVLTTVAALTMIGLLVGVGALVHLPWPVRAMATALAIVAGTVTVYGSLSMHTHRRLQPWCPWCQHGGRGPRSQATAPDPQPVGTSLT